MAYGARRRRSGEGSVRSNIVLAGALRLRLGAVLVTGRVESLAPESTAAARTTPPATSRPLPPPKEPKGSTAPPAVPAQRLKPGQRPPQFVIVSFDGAGDHDKWTFWRGVAK